MPPNARAALRAFGKLVAVVLVAGLTGAGIGIVVAALTNTDDPATTAGSEATTTATQTATSKPGGALPPRVAILLAQLGRTSQETRRARLIVRTRVTNRSDDTLKLTSPVLISGEDRVALDDGAAEGAGPLLGALGAGEDAVGVLKFTLPADVTARVTDDAKARLRIAGRTVDLKIRLPTSSG